MAGLQGDPGCTPRWSEGVDPGMSIAPVRGDEKVGVEDVEGSDRLLDLFHGGPSVAPIQIYPPPQPILLRRVPMADSHNRSQVGAIGPGGLRGQVDRSEWNRHPVLSFAFFEKVRMDVSDVYNFHVWWDVSEF